MSIVSTVDVLPAEAISMEMRNFGKATLADYFEDRIIYRDLEPLDPQLPGIKSAASIIGISNGHIPRKQEEDYAKAALWFLDVAQENRQVNKSLQELLFIGDSLFNDGTSFQHMQALSGWEGSCFIGNEQGGEPASTQMYDDRNIYSANRWSALGDWIAWLTEQGMQLNERTAVVVDIDKTALGAKGRNDAVIDQARLAGIYRTMNAVLGSNFDKKAFERQYDELNQPAYHSLTEDNQDYLAYTCLVLNTKLIGFEELADEVQKGCITHFEQFVRWVNTRLMINASGGERLRQVHETVMMSVNMGDPTPFKRFRREEFMTTTERMGVADKDDISEMLRSEITITNELVELAEWLSERNCLLICMSDKPSEASCPASHLAAELLPLHRVPAYRVGTSIRSVLDSLSA